MYPKSSAATLKRTKTLYTPVFYTSGHNPSSSASTSSTSLPHPTSKTPSAYLDHLSRTHVALAQIVMEVPSSRCGSPLADGEEEALDSDMSNNPRVVALRKRAQELFELAGGEPADGKWEHLVQLLKMGCTRGHYRWIKSRADGEAPKAARGWLLAKTEAEWFEWEKKAEEDERVMKKVESWQRRIEVVGSPAESDSLYAGDEFKVDARSGKLKAKANVEVESVPRPVKAQPAAKTTTRGTVDPPSLGFNVAKRTYLNPGNKAADKGKRTDNAVAGPSSLKSNANVGLLPSNASDSIFGVDLMGKGGSSKDIADVSEIFLPPSFPSQLPTSTPNSKPKPNSTREKPPPIPVLPSSSLPSLHTNNLYQYQNGNVTDTSGSLPAFPGNRVQRVSTVEGRKRFSPVTPERTLKKARTMPSPLTSSLPNPTSSNPRPPSSLPPSTPRNDTSSGRRASSPKRPGQLPTLTELLASAKKNKTSPKGKRQRVQVENAINGDGTDGKGQEKAKLPFPRDERPGEDPYDINMDIIADHSPAKSLSSIAESNSSSDSHPSLPRMPDFTRGDGEGFKPMSTSTPAQNGVLQEGILGIDDVGEGMGAETGTGLGRTGSSGLGFGMGYNSQFDVEGEVDRVGELLERDVDFGGWLRDVSVEAEENEIVMGLSP